MIAKIVLFLLVSMVFSSRPLRLSQEQIDQLAATLEAEFPGSVDSLFRWAKEEIILDQLEAAYTSPGQLDATKVHHTAMSLYIMSKNPLISEDRLDAELKRIFGSQSIPQHTAKSMMKSARSFITVPSWYHQYWVRIIMDRTPFEKGMDGLFRLISAHKAMGLIRETDVRFSMNMVPARALARLWVLFCVNVKPTEINCRHTIGTGDVTMSLETQQRALAFLAIRTMMDK